MDATNTGFPVKTSLKLPLQVLRLSEISLGSYKISIYKKN